MAESGNYTHYFQSGGHESVELWESKQTQTMPMASDSVQVGIRGLSQQTGA